MSVQLNVLHDHSGGYSGSLTEDLRPPVNQMAAAALLADRSVSSSISAAGTEQVTLCDDMM